MQLSFIILFFFVAYVTSSPSPPPAGMENEEATDLESVAGSVRGGRAARENAPEASTDHTAPDADDRAQDSSCVAGPSHSTFLVESEVIESAESHVLFIFCTCCHLIIISLRHVSPSLMMSSKVVLRCHLLRFWIRSTLTRSSKLH